MEAIDTTLEELFEKVRKLPEQEKAAAALVLEDLTQDSAYVLSEEELAILGPALERAKRGEFADQAEVDELLNKPWA